MLFVHDDRTGLHRVPLGFPEVPERVERILAGLRSDARFRLVGSDPRLDEEAVLEAVGRIHDPAYVERFRRAVARRDGLVDTADNPVSAGSFEATVGATAGALTALDLVLGGEGGGEGGNGNRRVFAAIRPPGHHAERASAMGFCFFDHVAVAAQRALDRFGLARVAIVDVDVHHGNGTQHLFEERADVFYASLHQYPFYPGTGAERERGVGAGEGATLNVPLRAGCGDEEWSRGLAEKVVPALEAFRPELLLISAGFDAWRRDPLGGQRVSEEGFAEMGRLLFDAGERLCGGRTAILLEGGYDLEALPRLATSFLTGSAQRAPE